MDVLRAVGDLSPELRDVVVLFYFDDLKTGEIAAILSIPHPTGPSVQGEPDYSKATLHWPKIIVISEGGVRAIDAVLRSTGERDNCGCEVLFNQPNKTTYWVWKLPMSASPVKKFSVDAKTFVVAHSAR